MAALFRRRSHKLPAILFVASIIGAANFLASNTEADQVIRIERPGWQFDPAAAPFAVRANGVAILLQRVHGDPETTSFLDRFESRILQVRDGQIYSTDLDGGVVGLEYSDDGVHLIATEQIVAQDDSPIRRTHLIDSDGRILWTKENARRYWFTDTGEAIYSAETSWTQPTFGKEVEILDLEGDVIRRVRTGNEIRGVLAFGDGKKVVLCVGRSVLMYSTTSTTLTRMWGVDLPETDLDVNRIASLGRNRFVIQQGPDFTIMDLEGKIEYSYYSDQVSVETAQGVVEREGMTPVRGLDDEHVVLKPHRSAQMGLELDIPAKTLTPVSFDVGFGPETRRGIHEGHVVLFAKDRMRLAPPRRVPPRSVVTRPCNTPGT